MIGLCRSRGLIVGVALRWLCSSLSSSVMGTVSGSCPAGFTRQLGGTARSGMDPLDISTLEQLLAHSISFAATRAVAARIGERRG
jgi:hypothetical protein